MADYFTSGSCFLPLSKEQVKKAQSVIDKAVAEIVEYDDINYILTDIEVKEDGVWFSSDDEFDPFDVEYVARSLVNEFNIDEVFYCSWANTCSKLHIDEFSGGAFMLKRGFKTERVTLRSELLKREAANAFTPEEN